MRLRRILQYPGSWKGIIPPELRADYKDQLDRSNGERLSTAAWMILAAFGLLLGQHFISPGVPREDWLYEAYLKVYGLIILLALVYLAISKAGKRKTKAAIEQYGFVLAILLCISALSLLDSRVSKDQTAFFLGSVGIAALFRSDLRCFASFVLLSAAMYIVGRYVGGDGAFGAGWTIPFIICAFLVIALAEAINRYDARAFMLNKDLVIANERLAAEALKEERNARALAAALEERNELFSELQIRVKSYLNIVASIFSVKEMQLGKDPSARVVGDMRMRIQALESFYDRLNRSNEIESVDFAAYASDIVDTMISTNPTGEGRIRIERNLSPLRLRLQKAIALSLMMNELFMNSMKHAFPSGREGKISVCLESDGVFGRLRVSDDGIGMPESGSAAGAAEPAGFGLKLVSLLGGQIGAKLRSIDGSGAITEIVFPIP